MKFKKPAYFDTSTGEIMNCEEGTLVYYHEEGHKDWFEKGIEQQNQIFSWAMVITFLPLITYFSTKNILLTIFSSLPVLFYILSETHAWIFAIKKYIKIKWKSK